MKENTDAGTRRNSEGGLPFFARFLERQHDTGEGMLATMKYPSDRDDYDETMKYPSDSDEWEEV